MAVYRQDARDPDPIEDFDPRPVMQEWGLTLKETMFCEWYLVLMSPGKAATKAGYAYPQIEGARLLGNAKVKAYLAHRFHQNKIQPSELLAHLMSIARADIADYLIVDPKLAQMIDGVVRVTDDGKVLDGVFLDLKRALRDGNTGAIKTFKRIKGELVIELHDRVKVIELLGKHFRMWAADVPPQPTGNNTADDLGDEELARIARGEKPTNEDQAGE